MATIHNSVLNKTTGKGSVNYFCSITDADFNVVETNHNFREILNSEYNNNFIGKPLYQLTSLIEREECLQARKTCLNNPDTVVKIDINTRDASGNNAWFRWEVSAIRDDHKNIAGICFIGEDISRQKLSEQELLNKASLLDCIADVVISTDLRFTITSWNKAAGELHGLAVPEALNQPIFETLQYQLLNDTIETISEKILTRGNWSGDLLFSPATGETRVLQASISTILNNENVPVGFVFVNRDGTAANARLDTVKKSYNPYHKMINEVKDYAIYLLDKNGIIQNWNKGAEQMKGYSEKEIVGKNFRIFYTAEDRQHDLPNLLLQRAHLYGRAEQEGFRMRKDGTTFWATIVITALYDDDGGIIGFSKVTRNLTERKNAENILKQSEQRFRSIFNSMYQFIGLLSPDGTVLEINKTSLLFAGLQPEEVVGKPLWECYWWTISARTQEQLKQAIAHAAGGKFVRYEVAIRGKDAVTALVDFSIKPITGEDGKVIMLIPEGRDITQARILQQQVNQEEENRKNEIIDVIIKAQEREREEISYELHDNINQKLATCKLLLEMDIRNRKEQVPEYVTNSYNYIEEIIQELRMISGSLCAYSLKEIGLIAAVKDLVKRINTAGKIQVNLDIPRTFKETQVGHDFKTAVFRILQEQVNNVLKHAEASNLYIHLERNNNELTLTVKDDGKGFNTKKIRRGLGINNIYNRVEFFKGNVTLTSKPGKGCMLQATMPLSKALL